MRTECTICGRKFYAQISMSEVLCTNCSSVTSRIEYLRRALEEHHDLPLNWQELLDSLIQS